jgi:molybdopterin converting factor small subunit
MYLPKIDINFIGPWRALLGTRNVTVDVDGIDEAKDYVDTKFVPILEKKVKSIEVGKKQSIWDNSNVLLNGTNIKTLKAVNFKEGDRLDLLPRVAGG